MTERLPEPQPARFPDLLKAHVRTLHADSVVGRIYFASGPYPSTWRTFRRWGPTSARFDHQPPPPSEHPTRSVSYGAPGRGAGAAAPVLRTCLAECFAETGTVDLATDDPYYALFRLRRAVRLLNVGDSDWVARAGGNAAIQSGPRDMARRWAGAIYDRYARPPAIEGIYYGCSIIPSARSVVLWDRASDALPDRPAFNRPLGDSSLRADVERFAAELHLDLVS